MKYKVGDKVQVVTKKEGFFCGFKPGDVVEVLRVDTSDSTLFCERAGSYQQWIHTENVVPIPQKIVITTDGVTTTARMFSGKELVKSAEAKCSKSDTFDFKKGAALAVDRLLGRLEEKAEPEVPKFPKFPKSELKTGVFGRMSNGWWFVIVDDSFIYESGKFDEVDQVDLDGALKYKAVDCLVKAVSFNNARSQASIGSFIWKRPSAKFD